MELITSRSNPLLVRVRRLVRDPSSYRRDGEVWIEGDHLITAALSRGMRPEVLVVDEAHAGRFDALANAAARAVSVPPDLMAGLSALESPAPVAALVRLPAQRSIEPGLPTVVLDRVQDAGNVGSILRSASALGFAQVVALVGTASLWSPKVLRAGMGAHFALRLVESREAADLPALRMPLLVADSHAPASLDAAVLPWPCAWVFGHEGQGVSADVRQACATSLRIPQPGGEESLNVAAAAAICLYESARQRAQRH